MLLERHEDLRTIHPCIRPVALSAVETRSRARRFGVVEALRRSVLFKAGSARVRDASAGVPSFDPSAQGSWPRLQIVPRAGRHRLAF